ncbi:hypothetical protein ACFQL1_08360 [Halomicroarcula sp. GCM10025709]|uniref:hypothetical protein n=1 Tax=Halomicroarcula sp. GCM10025709 TaxID=3252669 RepID=UPI0036096BA3
MPSRTVAATQTVAGARVGDRSALGGVVPHHVSTQAPGEQNSTGVTFLPAAVREHPCRLAASVASFA